jgi:hypothetical protein
LPRPSLSSAILAARYEREFPVKSQTALAIWILVFGAAMSQAQTGIWMGVGPAPRSETVKNDPFSADLITTNDHAAGQPGLNTTFHGKVARNSQGESYFAMELVRPVQDSTLPMRVTITNPAALTVTTLDQQSKVAYVSHITANTLNKAPILTPGSNVPTADGRPAGAVSATAAPTTNAKTEALGTKEIAGLKVVGMRVIRTSPPNGPADKPFVSTVDTWSSPELKVIVTTEVRTSNGDHHITRLENIVRTEPSAALFQVPSDYKVRDNMPMATNMH